MAENRHIFNNLTQVEKIKPKIDNPIIVEDVTYNFSDLIENEWISHFPQYSHRMRSTFVKGAGIVDEHIANINQGLIQLEDELYRVYDKLSDDIEAGAKDLMEGVQAEVDTFIQARNDEVASFISDRKSEVADFIKDRKNEVATFISDKQHLVDEFVQARQNEVANFIQSKTNEVSNYINQKEEQITRFIENKDNEIKRRTDTLDDYTKNLEGKIDQFNLVIQGGEATEDKLGLIKLSTIREQVDPTDENRFRNLITNHKHRENDYFSGLKTKHNLKANNLNELSDSEIVPKLKDKTFRDDVFKNSDISEKVFASEVASREVFASEVASREVFASEVARREVFASEVASREVFASEVAQVEMANPNFIRDFVIPNDDIKFVISKNSNRMNSFKKAIYNLRNSSSGLNTGNSDSGHGEYFEKSVALIGLSNYSAGYTNKYKFEIGDNIFEHETSETSHDLGPIARENVFVIFKGTRKSYTNDNWESWCEFDV